MNIFRRKSMFVDYINWIVNCKFSFVEDKKHKHDNASNNDTPSPNASNSTQSDYVSFRYTFTLLVLIVDCWKPIVNSTTIAEEIPQQPKILTKSDSSSSSLTYSHSTPLSSSPPRPITPSGRPHSGILHYYFRYFLNIHTVFLGGYYLPPRPQTPTSNTSNIVTTSTNQTRPLSGAYFGVALEELLKKHNEKGLVPTLIDQAISHLMSNEGNTFISFSLNTYLFEY